VKGGFFISARLSFAKASKPARSTLRRPSIRNFPSGRRATFRHRVGQRLQGRARFMRGAGGQFAQTRLVDFQDRRAFARRVDEGGVERQGLGQVRLVVEIGIGEAADQRVASADRGRGRQAQRAQDLGAGPGPTDRMARLDRGHARDPAPRADSKTAARL